MRVSPINQNYNNFNLQNKTTNFKASAKLPNNTKVEASLSKSLLNLGKSVCKLGKTLLFVAAVAIPTCIFNFAIATKRIHDEYPQVKPLEKNFPTQEAAINYSIERISEQLNSDNPREYAVNINNNKHRIISEAMGNDSTVNNFTPLKQFYNNITTPNYSYTALHGHPPEKDGSTTTFSFQDFKSFIHKDNCTINYVTNNQGKYCKMTKTENYRKPTKEEIDKLEEKFDFYFNAAWPHTKTIYNTKGETVFKITDYPGMHDYWDFTTKNFGIEYTTTFGTYGLYDDIYKNGYHEAFYEKEEIIK